MVVNSRRFDRTTTWMLALTLGVVTLTTACTSASEPTASPAKEIIIFIDFSESIRGDSWTLFERDLAKTILPSLSAGDRILVAPINDRTLTSFHPLVEASFPTNPSFNGWTDNTLQYAREVKKVEEQAEQIREELRTKLSGIFASGSSSQQTDIFSSLVIAQKLFDREDGHRVLILMSDMIVDYPPYRFDKMDWSAGKNEEILSDLAAKGSIPDLSGICVYVTGASGASAEQAGHISRFWQEYFERTRADMDPKRYAHVLLHWPPSKTCPA